MREQNIGIGELSKRTGVHIETVRYYERIGVLPKPPRTEGGYRLYDQEQIKRLSFVKRSRDLGFSLNEVRALLDLVDTGKYTCGQVHEMTKVHLESVRKKVADLRRLERVLKDMAAECSRGNIPDCPIVDTLFDEPKRTLT